MTDVLQLIWWAIIDLFPSRASLEAEIVAPNATSGLPLRGRDFHRQNTRTGFEPAAIDALKADLALIANEQTRFGAATRASENDWTSAAKHALLGASAGGSPTGRLGLASRFAGLWAVRASVPTPLQGAHGNVDLFSQESPQVQQRARGKGER